MMAPDGGARGHAAYEAARKIAAGDDETARLALADEAGVAPEILYFLAGDDAPGVRQAVARNAATPVHADLILARDVDDGVRLGLAERIDKLLPHLDPSARENLRAMTAEILGVLARDQLGRVRELLALALRDLDAAPPEVIDDVVNRLARDSELEVAGPLLEHSPLLTESVLLEIIGSTGMPAVVAAIAGRPNLSGSLADAVVGSAIDAAGTVSGGDSVAALLANPSAQIREETLDRIVAAAPGQTAWHEPLVRRPSLPERFVRRIAGFVAETLLRHLESRTDLDAAATKAVAEAVRERLDGAVDPVAGEAAVGAKPDKAGPANKAAKADGEKKSAREKKQEKAAKKKQAREEKKAAAKKKKEPEAETNLDRARRLHAAGELDEDALRSALTTGKRSFVRAGLVVMSGLPEAMVERILDSGSVKGVTSLAWKAGLEMRFAVQIQTRLAGIPPNQALNPRAGTRYPLSEEDMNWQLEFFGG